MIAPANHKKKTGKKGRKTWERTITPEAAACNKAKTKTNKDNLPFSDPLIRPLNRKQPEEHTRPHYLVKNTKNTGTGGPRVL